MGESGGIGRRTRLRIWRVKPWGFESPLSHQQLFCGNFYLCPFCFVPKLKQLQDAVTKNGFTMKQSEATLTGNVLDAAGKLQIQIGGSNDVLELIAGSQAGTDAKTFRVKP
jgi:hypothetical protein